LSGGSYIFCFLHVFLNLQYLKSFVIVNNKLCTCSS